MAKLSKSLFCFARIQTLTLTLTLTLNPDHILNFSSLFFLIFPIVCLQHALLNFTKRRYQISVVFRCSVAVSFGTAGTVPQPYFMPPPSYLLFIEQGLAVSSVYTIRDESIQRATSLEGSIQRRYIITSETSLNQDSTSKWHYPYITFASIAYGYTYTWGWALLSMYIYMSV